MRDASIFADGFKARPWWWEEAEPVALPALDLPDRAEAVIVGGGYTGLSAALTLGRLGLRPIVLDVERIGFGASSRNGGMVSGALKIAASDLAVRLGPERAARLVREASSSLAFLEETIAREGIDCAYRRTGRLIAAWTPGHYRALLARAESLADITGAPVHALPRERLREEIGSDYYSGGILVEAAGALHPARYVRGLAAAASRAGAILVDRTGARAIARSSDTFRIVTDRGEIAARSVLVATNGYTGANLAWFARRLIPVGSYMIATEELPSETIAALFPRGRMVSDTKRVLNYFRPDPDGRRVLWGGRASFRGVPPEEAAPALHRVMAEVFPTLKDVRITNAWTGNVAFTFDFLPHLGCHEGVHYALGCQGSGVALMTWLGHRAALKMAGAANSDTAFDALPFPTRSGYRGRPWFLPVVGTWYRLRDRIDRLTA